MMEPKRIIKLPAQGSRVRGEFKGVPFTGVGRAVQVVIHLDEPIVINGRTLGKSLVVVLDPATQDSWIEVMDGADTT